MEFIAWIAVVAIAGWLAGNLMKMGSEVLVVDPLPGVLNGTLGSWILSALGISPSSNRSLSTIVVFIRAVLI